MCQLPSPPHLLTLSIWQKSIESSKTPPLIPWLEKYVLLWGLCIYSQNALSNLAVGVLHICDGHSKDICFFRVNKAIVYSVVCLKLAIPFFFLNGRPYLEGCLAFHQYDTVLCPLVQLLLNSK